MAAPLRAAPDPPAEPIVLVIDGQTHVVEVDDPAWPIAYHARETGVQLKLAEGDLRGKRALIAELRKDRAAEAEKARLGNPAREAIIRVFDTWRIESGRKRCKLTPERFDMVAARFVEDYVEDVLTMAAVGIAVNPYVIEGETRNDFETAFKSGGQVERYANRCPADRRQVIRASVGEAQAALPV